MDNGIKPYIKFIMKKTVIEYDKILELFITLRQVDLSIVVGRPENYQELLSYFDGRKYIRPCLQYFVAKCKEHKLPLVYQEHNYAGQPKLFSQVIFNFWNRWHRSLINHELMTAGYLCAEIEKVIFNKAIYNYPLVDLRLKIGNFYNNVLMQKLHKKDYRAFRIEHFQQHSWLTTLSFEKIMEYK